MKWCACGTRSLSCFSSARFLDIVSVLSYLNWAFDIKVVKGLHKEEKAELDTFLKTRRLVIITMSCFGGVWVEKIRDMGREDVAVQSAVATYQELETSGKATQFNTAPKFRSFCYRFVTFNVCKSERNYFLEQFHVVLPAVWLT